MNEPKFTPGPWKIIPFRNAPDCFRIFSGSLYIGMADNSDNVNGQNAPNAALIAAAPEMYDVLQKLVEWNKKYPSNQDYHSVSGIVKIGDLCNAICKEAEQVLEKASGEI